MVTRELQADVPGLVDTVREKPSMLAAEASESRLKLTGNATVLAVDTAESIQAANCLKRCWHISSPPCTALACSRPSKAAMVNGTDLVKLSPRKTIEAARACSSFTFQDGLLTLERIRRGGKQTVKVVHQHVAVGPGGQAVVAAGGVKGGGPKTRGRGRK